MAAPKQARPGARSGRGPRPAAKGTAGGTGQAGTGQAGTGRNAGTSGTGRNGGTGGSGRNGSGRAGAADVRRPAAKAATATAAARPAQTRKARDRARARELEQQRALAEPAEAGPPPWLRYTSFVLALIGFGISIYLTIEHFTGNSTLACSDKGTINCGAVTTSPEAMVFGVFPVAVLGLAFFVFMVAATSPMAWRSRRREIALARLGSVIVGVGFILYLIYVELFQVGAICLWCTGVHVITFLLFVLIAMTAAVWGLDPAKSSQSR